MKLHCMLTAGALALLCSGTFAQASAPAATPKVDARQARQAARIEQGAASGALTQPEQRRLDAKQAQIGRIEDRAKADGQVTKAERARLAHEQHQAGRHIAKQKHDRQHAASAPAK